MNEVNDARADCPNAPMCKAYDEPQWVLKIHGGQCENCAIQLGSGRLRFVDEAEEACCICSEYNIQCVLRCGHMICVDCAALRYDEEPQPQPCQFGCPRNYEDSDDDLELEEEWIKSDVEQVAAFYSAYNDWEERDLARQQQQGQVLSRCPLCRAPLNFECAAQDM